MTREEIIDGLEIYTVGRLNKDRVHITVEELQKFIDEIETLGQESSSNIPFLLHKESGCPLDECVKAYEKANEYLRSKSKLKG